MIIEMIAYSDFYPKTQTYIPVLKIFREKSNSEIYAEVFDKIHNVRKIEYPHNVAVNFEAPNNCILLPNMVSKMYQIYKKHKKIVQ